MQLPRTIHLLLQLLALGAAPAPPPPPLSLPLMPPPLRAPPAGSMHTVDATAQSPGQALVQCRIGDHIAAGMTALYVVESEP